MARKTDKNLSKEDWQAKHFPEKDNPVRVEKPHDYGNEERRTHEKEEQEVWSDDTQRDKDKYWIHREKGRLGFKTITKQKSFWRC